MSRWIPALLVMIALGLTLFSLPSAGAKCVQVYYDAAPQERHQRFYFGRTHALYLQNLLGHFPEFQQYVIPVEKYQRGQLNRCEASFYLGNYYDNPLPAAFLDDFITTRRNVFWAGYNVWQLGADALDMLWGVKFVGLSRLDWDHRDDQNRPAFYKDFDYKGETFTKYGEYDIQDKKKFNAAYEIALLELTHPEAAKNVLSWARHSASGQKSPYVIRTGNHWYMADSPFAFTQEEDRYLIFADLLFDVLNTKPRRPPGHGLAFLRIEDIHPKTAVWSLYHATNFLAGERVPFAMSLIPIYIDPYNIENSGATYTTILENPYFIECLKYAGEHGATFLMHGVTHQYKTRPNPFSALTADDFEFWDRVRNRPIAEDSSEYVVNRIEDGYTLFEQAGIRPIAWLTPHYQASPLDYLVFGQLFRWNVGRAIYFPYEASQAQRLPERLALDVVGVEGASERMRYLSDLKLHYPEYLLPAGQFFPYEIYRDVYGQRIIPEDGGNLEPWLNEQVVKTETIDDMIRFIRKQRVIRDAWASFFVHLFFLHSRNHGGMGEFDGDMTALQRLISAARQYGFEFVDLKQWIKENTNPLPPPAIDLSDPIPDEATRIGR